MKHYTYRPLPRSRFWQPCVNVLYYRDEGLNMRAALSCQKSVLPPTHVSPYLCIISSLSTTHFAFQSPCLGIASNLANGVNQHIDKNLNFNAEGSASAARRGLFYNTLVLGKRPSSTLLRLKTTCSVQHWTFCTTPPSAPNFAVDFRLRGVTRKRQHTCGRRGACWNAKCKMTKKYATPGWGRPVFRKTTEDRNR